MRNVLLLSLAGLALSIAGLVALLTGCGSRTEVGALEQHPGANSKVEVSHWKQTGLGTRLYGMIVEQEGSRLSAALYALEDEEGLVIRDREAQGKFFPDRQAIIFPLYNPAAVPAEKWIAEGGPHLIVPWAPGAATLTGALKDPSRTNSYTFARLPVAPLTNGLGVAAVAH
jgi:hypothetical protein